MAPDSHPEWPDKAMFAAILLILAGAVGAAFRLLLPFMVVRQENLPQVFTEDIPGYELVLCLATLAAGILSLRRQAAVFAYVGASFAILSLAVYGLVPFLGLLALAAMVKSHMEGEETRNDGIELDVSKWPDKAMATSLFLVVLGSIAVLQGILMLAGKFEPILIASAPVAGFIGILIGLFGFLAAREVYHLRHPWMGWVALVTGLATMGFYLIGPVLAAIGMVLLALAHKEDEFLEHSEDGQPAPAGHAASAVKARKPSPVRRGRRRRPSST